MEATFSLDGYLILIPNNEIEAYALTTWYHTKLVYDEFKDKWDLKVKISNIKNNLNIKGK